MEWVGQAFLYLKYALAIVVITTIILAPAWLGVINGKNKTTIVYIRFYSWMFGWTVIGWIIALYIAVKK